MTLGVPRVGLFRYWGLILGLWSISLDSTRICVSLSGSTRDLSLNIIWCVVESYGYSGLFVISPHSQ